MPLLPPNHHTRVTRKTFAPGTAQLRGKVSTRKATGKQEETRLASGRHWLRVCTSKTRKGTGKQGQGTHLVPAAMMETRFCPASDSGALDQTEIFYPPMAASTVALSRTFQLAHMGDKLAQSDHIRADSRFSPVLPSLIYWGWCLPGVPVSLRAGSNPLLRLPVPPPPNRTSPGLRYK